MFRDAFTFNQPIGKWDVDNVLDMRRAFQNALAFNNGGSANINNWRPSKCTNFDDMFNNAQVFNQPIGDWDMIRAVDMSRMFNNAFAFNQNIGTWTFTGLTTLTQMFWIATNFDNGGSPSINNWNVSGVTNMQTMFHSSEFNQPIGNWDTRSVTNMSAMFFNTPNFNQNISGWTLSAITWTDANNNGLIDMFGDSDAFNQDLSGWCVTQILSSPLYFAGNTPAWTLPKPNWGAACPP
jgi:surface protein